GDFSPVVDRMIQSCQGVSFWIGDKHAGKTGDHDREGVVLVDFPRGSKLATELVDVVVKRAHGRKLAGDRFAVTIDKDTFEIMAIGDLFAFSDDDASLTKTVDVLAGKGRALADKAIPGGPPASDLFFFAALGTSLLDDVKQAAVTALLPTDTTCLALNIRQVR